MIQPITPVSITAFTATTGCGVGRDAMLRALSERRSGLTPNDFGHDPLPTYVGRVQEIEALSFPAEFAVHDCRNNRLAWLGLLADGFVDSAKAAVDRYGPDRVALLLATSTSSIGATEEAYTRLTDDKRFPEDLRRPEVHHPHSLGAFLRSVLGCTGPTVTTATACSSSAKVFAQAERMLRLGLIDAAIVGGVDTLCGAVLFGFNALELVSPEPCRPCDVQRRGINLGEAAGFALIERGGPASAPQLLGWGESSDAHHMSTPHPEGLGARLAIEGALARAGLDVESVGYINMHGTASQKNDEVEAGLIARMFPAHTLASSTKGWTGHTLGAAGIVEAVISLLVLETGLVPGCLNAEELDPVCGPQVQIANHQATINTVLSNSFGFGGNNAALLFGKGAAARHSTCRLAVWRFTRLSHRVGLMREPCCEVKPNSWRHQPAGLKTVCWPQLSDVVPPIPWPLRCILPKLPAPMPAVRRPTWPASSRPLMAIWRSTITCARPWRPRRA